MFSFGSGIIPLVKIDKIINYTKLIRAHRFENALKIHIIPWGNYYFKRIVIKHITQTSIKSIQYNTTK